MAKTKQTARKSTGGSAAKGRQKRMQSYKRQARMLDEQAELDKLDRLPRKFTKDDSRVSLSGKSKYMTGLYKEKNYSKIVPVEAPASKTRLDVFTAEELEKSVDERLRTVRLIKLLDDRRGALVEYMDGVETWQDPEYLLAAGGNCNGWLECIRAFMEASETELLKFLKSHPFGRRYDGADEDGLCGFRAVQAATRFLGLEVTDAEISDYVEATCVSRGIQLSEGTNFAELRRFLRLRQLPLNWVILNKNMNSGQANGATGVRSAIGAADGVFLVAGLVSGTSWGHVVAVWKAGERVVVLDEGTALKLEDLTWLNELSYIRKVELQA